jgi:hypothetical protein
MAMIKFSVKSVVLVLVLLLAGTLGMTSPAHSYWTDMHGTNGVLQYPGNTAGWAYYGNGLAFTEQPALPNYVHYQIPVSDGKRKVAQIYIRHYRSNTNGRLASVSVYNGWTLVKTVALPSAQPVGYLTHTINLGGYYNIYPAALGVTLNFYQSSAGTTTYRVSTVSGNLFP